MRLKRSFKRLWQQINAKSAAYSKIGKQKVEALSIKKEIEEKFLELGGIVFRKIGKEGQTNFEKDLAVRHLVEQIRELEKQLEEVQKSEAGS